MGTAYLLEQFNSSKGLLEVSVERLSLDLALQNVHSSLKDCDLVKIQRKASFSGEMDFLQVLDYALLFLKVGLALNLDGL